MTPSKRRESDRKRRAKAINEGRCQVCITRVAIPGKRSCEICRERSRVYSKTCRIKRPDKCKSYVLRWYKANKQRVSKQHKERRDNIKYLIFEHYGNACACCNESHKEFLTIDHINNDGALFRKNNPNKRSNAAFYKSIIDSNFPTNLQLLCWNCNCAKQFHNICPHKKV